MKSKVLSLSIISLLMICSFASEVFAQSIPEPKAKIHCSYDDNWYSPEEYSIYCKPKSQSSKLYTPSPGLKPEEQMQLMMMQSILQPLFNSLFDFSNLFAPSGPSRQEIEIQRQEQLRRQQEERAKQEALNRWLQVQAEAERERAAEEARKRGEGQKILARSSISGSSGGLTPFSWRSSQISLTPISLKGYETKSFSPIEQLLCSAYFSKLAEGSMHGGDLEGARFYASQIDNVIQGQPTLIECKPPKELASSINTRNAIELNRKYTQMANLYKEVTPKIEKLSDVQIKLDEAVKKKEESKKKIEEVEKQIEELTIKAKIEDKPDKKAETDDLLAKALALKKEAEKEHQDALAQQQKLTQEKESLEKEIEQIKLKYQEGGER